MSEESLRWRVDSLGELPEEYQKLYEKRTGGFFLRVQGGVVSKERLDEFREHNIALRQKLEELADSKEGTTQIKGRAEGSFHKENEEKEENEEKPKIKETTLKKQSLTEGATLKKQSLTEEATQRSESLTEEAKRGSLEEIQETKKAEEELSKLRKELTKLRIEKREEELREKVFSEGLKMGVLREAKQDLWARFKDTQWYREHIEKLDRTWEKEKKEKKEKEPETGFQEEKVYEWIGSLRESAGHLFTKSSGGGQRTLATRVEGIGSVIYGDPREFLAGLKTN